MRKRLLNLSAILILVAMLAGMILPVAVAAAETEGAVSVAAPSIPARPGSTTKPAQTGAYEEIATPGSDAANWYGKPYGTWKAGNNAKYFLSDMTYLESSNTTSDDYSNGQPTTVNHPYATKEGTKFYFGEGDAAWEVSKGIGMHPKNPQKPVFSNRTDSWTIYDISQYTAANSATPANTFYALVGLTAETDRNLSKGVLVYIYGDKTGDGNHYELLAASTKITGYNIGELNVNVEGVKLLLIDVVLPLGASSHGYSGIGFGNACLFRADTQAQKPDYRSDYCLGDDHVYRNGIWEQHSDTQHKMTCDCGENVAYEDHFFDDGVDSIDPENELIGITTYTCYDCDYQTITTYEIEPEVKEPSDETSATTETSATSESADTIEISLPGCFSVTGGSALSIALMGLSAALVSMKKKRSDDED